MNRSANPRETRRGRIQTTLLGLVQAVNELTSDDGLVVAAVSHLIDSCRVKTTRSLAPVRVIADDTLRPMRRGELQPAPVTSA